MIGITGYGSYVPRYRIKAEEIARVWNQDPENIKKALVIEEKSVPAIDEDTITMSVESGKNAINSAGIDPQSVGALFVGSESHPYIVKPSGTVVAEALNITPELMLADFEFACKAGTAAIQCCLGLVKSGMVNYGMAIGSDTAQGMPGDALEYTAAAGSAAFVIGKDPLATIDETYSYTTDTPDFWRREGESYPRHGARFTGEPAYFRHVIGATKGLLNKTGMQPSDFDYVVFHMPNGKFPLAAAKKLGFEKAKLMQSLIVKMIGNTYSASSLLGLCSVLDVAKPGQRILLTSFGSGAGSDSFSLTVKDRIEERRGLAPLLQDYIEKKSYVDYANYVRLRKKLKM
jgi:hydroxymethylglutaryl-CoA synthase